MKEELKITHVKLISTGRVFVATPNLLANSDFIPCSPSGQAATGITSVPGEDEVTGRLKTDFLGNITNCVLYPYTEILALNPDLESVNSPQEWRERLVALGKTPIPVREVTKESDDAPKLGREKMPEKPQDEKSAEVDKLVAEKSDPAPPAPPTVIADASGLPDIKGLGARDAKTVLAKWAEQGFGHRIDRRPSLKDVIAECESLVHGQQKAG